MSKFLFIKINLIIFFTALYILDFIDLHKSESAEYSEIQVINRDIAIPNMTLTNEIKTGMFLDGLRVDSSIIRPDDIAKSISSWEHYIKQYSNKYGIDPDLVRAIIYTESKGDPMVTSKNGAQGLMQIMPVTADLMGISDPFDPEENIKAGVKYIAWLIKNNKINNDVYLLWAWNAGPSMISKKIIPGETKEFIIEVLSVKAFLERIKTVQLDEELKKGSVSDKFFY